MAHFARTISLGVGFLSALFLFTMYSVPRLWLFSAVLVVWIAAFVFADLRLSLSASAAAIQVFSVLSFTILLSLIEHRALIVGLLLLCAAAFTLVWEWSVGEHLRTLAIPDKPLRRSVVMVAVFDCFAWFTALYAFDIFFPAVPFWTLALAGAVVGVFGAMLVWSLYYKTPLRSLSLWAAVLALLVIEFLFVLHTLPFGYFALGLLAVWLWYLIQLFIRFHVSARGVVWSRQVWFLAGNAAAMALTLFGLRWI